MSVPFVSPALQATNVALGILGLGVSLAADEVLESADVPMGYRLTAIGGTLYTASALTRGLPAANHTVGMLPVFFTQQILSSFLWDRLGIEVGTTANHWLSAATGALPFFAAPYVPALRIALGSTAGIGLTAAEGGGLLGGRIFLAGGGAAGGTGFLGATFQGLGVAGAVALGNQLGGWLVDELTTDGGENDPYGELAALARGRMEYDAYGSVGGALFGDVMNGVVCLFGYGDEMVEGLEVATRDLRNDADRWADSLRDESIVDIAAGSLNTEGGFDWDAFQNHLTAFYAANRENIDAGYRLIRLFDETGNPSREGEGFRSLVDATGRIADRDALLRHLINAIPDRYQSVTETVNTLALAQGFAEYDGSGQVVFRSFAGCDETRTHFPTCDDMRDLARKDVLLYQLFFTLTKETS